MTLPVFTENKACTSGQHCRTCRNLVGGRGWRQGLAVAFTLPADAPDFPCPHGKAWGYDEPPPRPAIPPRVPKSPDPEARKKRLERVGRKLWGLLHPWTLTNDPDPAVWIKRFRSRVPCGECKTELDAILKEMPCPENPAERFPWGVKVHNRVNVKLGKPELTEAEARAIY